MSLNGDYSAVVIYDEQKRYYLMQAQRNKPLLDAEIRHMDKARFDGLRRALQSQLGDVASPLETFSSPLSSTNMAFKVVQADDPDFGLSGTTVNNFAVVGGDGTLDSPGVLYFKGIYVFFKSHVQYRNQNDTGSLDDDDFTKTQIPALTVPIAGNRADIVYVDISFDEAGSAADTTYLDPELRDTTIGTDTANRLRAVFDIRVYEGWTQPTDKTIFSNVFFGYFPGTVEHYKVPIAIINRPGNTSTIVNSYITDLLDRDEKRVFTPKELTWNIRHGGSTGVGNLWNTPGQNQGFPSQALNDDAATPRVVQDIGKFKMNALVVGATGVSSEITNDPNVLNPGETVTDRNYLNHAVVGYDNGIGLTGARNINDRVFADTLGLPTGSAGISIKSRGQTGVRSLALGLNPLSPEVSIDHRGYVGLQRPDPQYPLDIVGTVRISQDLILGGNLFVTINETIGGTLDVNGDANLHDALIVDGFATIGSFLTVAGLTILSGTLEVDSATTLFGTLTVHQGTVLDDTLDVVGITTLQDALTVTGPVSLLGTLTVETQQTNLLGGLYVEDPTTLNGALSVVQDITALSGIIVTQGITTGSDVVVGGNLTAAENVSSGLDLVVGQDGHVLRNLFVDQDENVLRDLSVGQDLAIARNVNIGNGLEVFLDINVGRNLDVSVDGHFGNDIFSIRDISVGRNLVVTDFASIGSTLSVGGNVNIAGDYFGLSMIMTNLAQMQTLSVLGNATISGHLNLFGYSDAIGVVDHGTLNPLAISVQFKCVGGVNDGSLTAPFNLYYVKHTLGRLVYVYFDCPYSIKPCTNFQVFLASDGVSLPPIASMGCLSGLLVNQGFVIPMTDVGFGNTFIGNVIVQNITGGPHPGVSFIFTRQDGNPFGGSGVSFTNEGAPSFQYLGSNP